MERWKKLYRLFLEGYYENDKKNGYGIFSWKDGKMYQGWWLSGKQYGLGKFIINNESTYGLWEKGKVVKVFNEKEVALIEKDELEFKDFFSDSISKNLFNSNQKFSSPENFAINAGNILKLEMKKEYL